MTRGETVGSICHSFDSVRGDEDGPKFILWVDGRQPQIYEVWTFGEDGVTRKVHQKAQVGVGTGFVG